MSNKHVHGEGWPNKCYPHLTVFQIFGVIWQSFEFNPFVCTGGKPLQHSIVPVNAWLICVPCGNLSEKKTLVNNEPPLSSSVMKPMHYDQIILISLFIVQERHFCETRRCNFLEDRKCKSLGLPERGRTKRNDRSVSPGCFLSASWAILGRFFDSPVLKPQLF